MDSNHDKRRMNVEDDRISNLPDDLIHKILSFVSIKQAIETSGLSSRWRYIWTTMPYLNLSTKDFSRLPKFSKFVTRLLSNRNNEHNVFSVNLTFRGKVWQEFVKTILDYAFSHNVQQLNITCLLGYTYPLAEFPPSLFSSQSIKHLTLTGRIDSHITLTIPTWVMPNLTTLNLHDVSFFDKKCDDLFSNCPNLRNLTFHSCIMLNSVIICHPELSSLTLERGSKGVKVVTPQLKNLNIKYWRGIHLASAPNLSFLCYTDHYGLYKDNDVGPLQLPTDLLHLEKVDICINSLHENKAYTDKIVCLLQQLRYVKFFTLNLELVKFFSSVDIISHQPSPFVNLKSLKVYPVYVTPEAQQTVTMSAEVKNYLLDGSPEATFTMVSHEEIKAVKDVTSARNLIRELENTLKEYFETKMTDKVLDKVSMERHLATPRKINAMFPKISALLKMVPTSHRDELEARFYGLCEKTNTTLKDHMNQHDNTFHEPATSSQPSS